MSRQAFARATHPPVGSALGGAPPGWRVGRRETARRHGTHLQKMWSQKPTMVQSPCAGALMASLPRTELYAFRSCSNGRVSSSSARIDSRQ